MKVLVTGGSGFIGTNLIEALMERNIDFVNLDIKPPPQRIQDDYWQKCDILDLESLSGIFMRFQPTHVIHLAGRTDTTSADLRDYRVNTDGTANVLRGIQCVSSVKHIVVTSSQFVCAPPGLPESDEDYDPIGAYGASKVIAEKLTRSTDFNCAWTIVRPTNIWGPWHPRYPSEFWLVLKRRLYVHPGGRSAIRSYGYVKNVVFQLLKILEAPLSVVDRKVYYLGDPPINLLEWVNGFSVAITGRPARTVPRWLFKALAMGGSFAGIFGIRFPIQLSRYRSMTEDYLSPMEPTIANFGYPPYSLKDGIKETVDWLSDFWRNPYS